MIRSTRPAIFCNVIVEDAMPLAGSWLHHGIPKQLHASPDQAVMDHTDHTYKCNHRHLIADLIAHGCKTRSAGGSHSHGFTSFTQLSKAALVFSARP